MQLPLNSVLSTDDGFFVVPEDEFFNPGDYGGESSLSSEGEKYSLYAQNFKRCTECAIYIKGDESIDS